MDEPNPTEEKKKGPLGKLKDFAQDKESQLELVSVGVRLLVVFWTGGIVTLNYVSIPGIANEPKDITFPASLLTGALASFGLEKSGRKTDDGTYKVDSEDKPMNKKEIEALLANQTAGANVQTIRVETPIRIIGAELIPPPDSPTV
jgi:hypothetical protein